MTQNSRQRADRVPSAVLAISMALALGAFALVLRFAELIEPFLPIIVLGAGLFISLLLFGLVRTLRSHRYRANALAEMTNASWATEQRYREVVEQATDMISIYDRKGRITFANPTVSKILGYTQEELMGKPYLDLVAPEHRAHVEEFYNGQFAGRETASYFEFPVLTRDGREIWIGQNVHMLAEEGKVVGFHAVGRDITEQIRIERAREKAEEALRRSKDAYRELFENANDVVFTHDLEGLITSLNRMGETVLGYSYEHTPDLTLEKLLPPADRRLVLETMERLLRGWHGGATSYELEMIRSDGSRLPMEVSARLIYESDKPVAIQGIARDMTERKRVAAELERARQAAEEAARLKAEFLANMSHEIRTPLNGIVGAIEILMRSPLETEQRDMAQIIHTSAGALLRIINDILDFSKIEAGRMTFESTTFDLRETVEVSVDMLAPAAQSKGIELLSAFEGAVPRSVRGDPTRLRQVLINLISNAIKFTSQGDVVVRVEKTGKRDGADLLRFSVRDTGIGIDPSDFDRIFQSFSQADGSTTRKFGGTGLGLAISKQLVEGMAGQIGVESELGQGSTFWFTLALPREAAKAEEPLPQARILLMADHPTSRAILEQQLTSWKLEYATAESVEQGRTLARATGRLGRPFDLAILDIHMPIDETLSVAGAIRSDPDLSATRLLLLTKLGRRASDAEQFRAAGISGFLRKPVKQSQLYASLRSLLVEEEPSVAVPQRTERAGAPSVDLRILLAEDNAVNRRIAMLQLRDLGYEPDTANNGREVLELFKSGPYDLVLMDCQMPELDGYEASAEIRRREGAEHRAVIVAITASVLERDRERCIEAGMDDYLSKPVQREDLKRVLDRWAGEIASNGRGLRIVDFQKLRMLGSLAGDGTELIAELRDLFLEESAMRLSSIQSALQGGDATALWKEAHALKSGCGNVGAERLSAICLAIERRGRAGQIEGADRLVAQLGRELARVQTLLKDETLLARS